MNRKKLNELLDCIYELEGLVQLAIAREDAPSRILALIKEKGEKIGADAIAISSPVVTEEKDEDSLSVISSVETPAGSESEGIGEYVVVDDSDGDEPRGRIVFTLNDRYRFKRALFDNDEAEFNNTLAIVASMENYDEAESYFIDELQWDEDKDEVKEFMSILKKYFNS